MDREDRLCNCGEVQDERHVLLSCESTVTIRRRYIGRLDFTSLELLMNGDPRDVTVYCDEALTAIYSM